MADIRIYQIFYDEQTRSKLDPGFIPLDNLSNERPDWREYWPIRKFLGGRSLAPDSYYGFFSPKFREKTGLSAEQVRQFIERQGNDADVVLFSPFFDMSALFVNVFEQGERYHPGLMKAVQGFIDRAGLNISIEGLITDSRSTVYSNYFVAKSRFWAKWLKINEQLFQISENAADDGEFRRSLLADAQYGHSVQMKVFVLERIATLMLATSGAYSTKAHGPLSFILPDIVSGNCVLETVCSDALKTAWIEQGHAAYRDAYYDLRQTVERKAGIKLDRSVTER